ncbi:MAG: 3-deoxy-D-manno-octulosonic acid transferase [Candidatus Omnitrophota bacterium]
MQRIQGPEPAVYGSRVADAAARWFFNAVFFLFSLAYLPVFRVKIRQAEDPARLMRERFGKLPENWPARLHGKKTVWIHAVSVGEVMAVRKFVEEFLARFPSHSIVLTTVTGTGQKVAQTLAGDRVLVGYYPFDFSFAVRRFFATIRPQAILLVETEIWPNLVLEGVRRGTPIGIVNARLSPRAFRRYRLLRFLLGPVFKALAFVLAQTEEDAGRFDGMGAARGNIRVLGNMKFDNASFEGVSDGERRALRGQYGFGPQDKIWISGSTHPGEEEKLARVFLALRRRGLALKWVLAPRHVERTPQVRGLLTQAGLSVRLASETDGRAEFDVLILDAMGLLNKMYAVAAAAFLGGSWVRHGGQNPIEPASVGCPVLYGPHVFNFEKIYQTLSESRGGRLVAGEPELEEALQELLGDPASASAMGANACRAVVNLRGATPRHLDWLGTFMNQPSEEMKNHGVCDQKLFPAASGRQ